MNASGRPHRYQVVVTEPDGAEQSVEVVTWAGPAKAIEIATGAALRSPGKGRPQPRATAVDLGSVDLDADGIIRLRPTDRFDRGEF